LHDDLNQQIALLSVEMELLARETSASPEQRSHHIELVAARIKGLSSEVHKLSYQLHPAKLDQLGLVSAARSFCRELSQQSGLKIEFNQKNVPRDIDGEISLCAYRIIQESLQNVVRHGEASSAEVRLQCEGNRLTLLIGDTGKGFDLEAARRRGGLGLISMEERARLVHGTFLIYSHPGEGTHIKLSIPLDRAPRSQGDGVW
jgi:signal transduction histidine kinase